MDELPRLLKDFPPAAGLVKADYNDFVVEEVPLYPFDETGTHTLFLVEKTGLTTMQAVNDLARALNAPRHDIGFAGQKDARAVARQWMSIEHVPPERIEQLDIPRVRILETTRHHNKLRLGHLKGNFFTIRVRQTEAERLAELQDAISALTRRGVPNYFGEQRFGYRGDTWKIGRALVRGDPEEAVDHLLGRPTEADHGDVRRARKLYDAGRYEQAARTWPRIFNTERRALRAIVRTGGKRRKAIGAVDRSVRNFYISAYQSHLFNQAVAARIAGLGELWDGDLAWLHASGAVFRVEGAAAEQPRADRFEISPTGPLFGYRMTEPTGRAAELEAAIFAAEQLEPGNLRTGGPARVKGGRRPLRYEPTEAQLSLGADERGPYLELRFLLPRGSYATALLRELFRAEAAETESETGPTEESAG